MLGRLGSVLFSVQTGLLNTSECYSNRTWVVVLLHQEATGPLEKFAQMLSTPAYQPLVGLTQYSMLRDIQISPNRFVQLVEVQPDDQTIPDKRSRVFAWAVSLPHLDVPLPQSPCFLQRDFHPVRPYRNLVPSSTKEQGS